MMKTNRLIRDIMRQTKDTVISYFNALAAANYTMYSTRLRGLNPHLPGCDIYLYADAATIVVVCLDCCGNNDQQTYAEAEPTGPFVYGDGREPRVSMVWKLSETMRQIRDSLQVIGRDTTMVFGVLLTEATILNADDMEDCWAAMSIKVIDGFKRLKYKKIAVNDDDELEGKALVNVLLDADSKDASGKTTTETSDQSDRTETSDLSEKTQISFEESEFNRMLTEYINREYEEEFGHKNSGAAGDDDEDDEDDEEEYEDDDDEDDDDDDTDLDDLLADNLDDIPDNIFMPDGTVTQNGNVQVEVEILRPTAHPREELDKLVGCADIKRRMDELVALTTYNKMMREQFPDSKQHAVSLHSIFLGRPGTGKTTVCKIFGSLMRQAGALSKGHVVVCDRGTFIGTLWGDEERSVRQVIEKARGGVLMIDEAYLLNSKHDHDPGKMVVQLLMNILADETQRDIAIVLCGYKEPMMKMLDLNPGLQSRFPNRFEFADFTLDELQEITLRRVREYEYAFTPPAWTKYCDTLAQAYRQRNPQTWGNARFVANLLERIYIQHASRCVREQPADKCQLRLITPDDILPIEMPREQKRIGF